MRVDLNALKHSGEAVKQLGADVEAAVEAGHDGFTGGGTSNEGFSAVGAVAGAAAVWLPHIEGIGGALENAGGMIAQTSFAFDTTDRYNADHLLGVIKNQLPGTQ